MSECAMDVVSPQDNMQSLEKLESGHVVFIPTG